MRIVPRGLSLAAPIAILFLLATGAEAADGAASYQYLIGTGFLCDIDPSFCPEVTMAANGDLIVITGEGTLSVHPNSATGSGTFTHKDSGGNVLGSGTWTATQLLSFKDFGAGPGFPEGFTGGHAVIGVHLSPSEGGDGVDGILIVDCQLGTSPPGLEEGVRLALTGINFNEKVSGNNIFIRQ